VGTFLRHSVDQVEQIMCNIICIKWLLVFHTRRSAIVDCTAHRVWNV